MKKILKGAVVSSMVYIGVIGAMGTIQIRNDIVISNVKYESNSGLVASNGDGITSEVMESDTIFDSQDISVTMWDGSQDMFSDSETQQMHIYVDSTEDATITKVELVYYREELVVTWNEALEDTTNNLWSALISPNTNAYRVEITATQDIGDANGNFTATNSFEFTYYPDGLSGGAIAGIIIGSLVVVGLIVGEGYHFYTTKKQRK